jgi:hypothetical protein
LSYNYYKLKAISVFGDLRSFGYDQTRIDGTLEGNNWFKIRQETLHQLLLVIFSCYQKIHSLSDLREVMMGLLVRDEIKIPETFVGWTNEFLHTHSQSFYHPDRSDIVNIMEQLSVQKVVEECYGDSEITRDGSIAFCCYVPSICEMYPRPVFLTSEQTFGIWLLRDLTKTRDE